MLKLIINTKLTHDVYELTFSSEKALSPKPGQFVLLTLPSGLKRAYSIAYSQNDKIVLIVKRLENGLGGSRELCDLAVGLELAFL